MISTRSVNHAPVSIRERLSQEPAVGIQMATGFFLPKATVLAVVALLLVGNSDASTSKCLPEWPCEPCIDSGPNSCPCSLGKDGERDGWGCYTPLSCSSISDCNCKDGGTPRCGKCPPDIGSRYMDTNVCYCRNELIGYNDDVGKSCLQTRFTICTDSVFPQPRKIEIATDIVYCIC